MESLKQFTDHQLISELERRNYCTTLLWNICDVRQAVDDYNEFNNTDYAISDQDAKVILDNALNDEFLMTKGNEYISEMVYSKFSPEEHS